MTKQVAEIVKKSRVLSKRFLIFWKMTPSVYWQVFSFFVQKFHKNRVKQLLFIGLLNFEH